VDLDPHRLCLDVLSESKPGQLVSFRGGCRGLCGPFGAALPGQADRDPVRSRIFHRPNFLLLELGLQQLAVARHASLEVALVQFRSDRRGLVVHRGVLRVSDLVSAENSSGAGISAQPARGPAGSIQLRISDMAASAVAHCPRDTSKCVTARIWRGLMPFIRMPRVFSAAVSSVVASPVPAMSKITILV